MAHEETREEVMVTHVESFLFCIIIFSCTSINLIYPNDKLLNKIHLNAHLFISSMETTTMLGTSDIKQVDMKYQIQYYYMI